MLWSAVPAGATDVNIIGLFSNKAVVVINNGQPRTLSVGQTSPEGVTLISADSKSATLEVDGRRQTLSVGSQIFSSAKESSNAKVTLIADPRGHFLTDGSINGLTVRFLVDTGASVIALAPGDADRLGINYKKGQRVFFQSANGAAAAYLVKLDTVKVGDIVMHNVDGIVQEANSGMGVALLGMSFLNRTEMKREGDTMTLIKRY